MPQCGSPALISLTNQDERGLVSRREETDMPHPFSSLRWSSIKLAICLVCHARVYYNGGVPLSRYVGTTLVWLDI